MCLDRFASLFLILLITACGVKQVIHFEELPKEPIQQIPNELRGAVVSSYSWTDASPDTMKNRISRIMKNLADAHFNAVFFRVREQAQTLYPSPIDIWSKHLAYKNPGFDPVKLAIEHAREYGLKFYAFVDLLSLWNEDEPPEDPNHLYFKHGPKVDPEKSWLCIAEDGSPIKKAEDFYLNPALPEVKSYLKKVIHHFVESYDCDGLFFDRIHYPGSQYINDPFSLQKFARDSLHARLSKGDWARKQLTDLVEDVVVEAMLVKPYLVISAATWGLYRGDDIPGYKLFKSGYSEYYQDAIDWLDKGLVDYIMPMIYSDIKDPLPNFNELWLDFKRRTKNYSYVYPMLQLNPEWIENGETASQINFVRRNDGLGTVLFSPDPFKDKSLQIIRDIIFPDQVDLPGYLKRVKPEQFVGLDVGELLTARKDGRNVTLLKGRRSKLTDSEGRIGLITSEKVKMLDIVTEQDSVNLPTRSWSTPYNYVVLSDNSVTRRSPWVELRRTPTDETDNSEFHLLCKTGYPSQAWIGSDTVKVYKTGIFFKKIKFKEGSNRVPIKIITEDSASALYEREFIYKPTDKTRKPFPLWIDNKSVEPNTDMILMHEDIIRISFIGSKAQTASVEVYPGKLKLPCSRNDFSDYSIYLTELPLQLLKNEVRYSINLFLKSNTDGAIQETHEYNLPIVVQSQTLDKFPLVKTIQPNAILSYSLGKVRLGSPIRAEYGPGVILKTNGKIGEYYRVTLSRTEEGYIHQNEVDELPRETVRPSYFINSMYCSPDSDADILRIPYLEPVPYSVYPEPDQKKIIISLYGAKTSSTWITHLNHRRYIESVTWKQTTPETYQAIVNLKTSKIWGYEINPEGSSLLFRVKYPPILNEDDSDRMLSGLKIAIEAGHGGDNLGAIGLSGLLEKDVNLDLAMKLADICQANGAEVLQVRDKDEYMTLTTKRDTARFSNAHILISIHANAAGTRDGYLRVGGTSTYYNNPFWAKLAEKIYDRLLELNVDEFGVIGSFNYKVIRVTEMPSILVEQAFMSHAEDEEKLAFNQFRQDMAKKIYQGLIDFIKYMSAHDE